MSDDSTNPSDPRIETGSRARELPRAAHLKKRFDKFQDFIDEYSSRISLGGIFVDADLLRPVGTEVYLDFRLEDGYRLLHGLGEVVWVRLKTMSDERPKGMGVRFLSLDEGGRELVLKLLEEQVKGGGAPFEVDRVPEDGSIDPTVVQALAGPSDEENKAAHRARTGTQDQTEPESASDDAESPDDESSDDDTQDEELPDLPPGVLPPPDEEPDFSAPWGEQLPEIPDDLLDEPAAAASSSASPQAPTPTPSIPAVEAPESPYAPGSDSHGEDPHLDESDFGATATEPPKLEAVGDATSVHSRLEPFDDFDGESVPEVDGTLFQLPDASDGAETSAATETGTEFDAAAAAAPLAAASPPSVGDSGTAVDSGAPVEPAPSDDGPSFEGGFDAAGGGFDAGGFDAGFDADDFASEFGDDSTSQVAPPSDIGDAAGAAWSADYDPDTAGDAAAMDAALDLDDDLDDDLDADAEDGQADGADDFAFEPPDEDLIQEEPEQTSFDDSFEDSGWSTTGGAGEDFAGGVTDDGIDATHAAVSSFEGEPAGLSDDYGGVTRPMPDREEMAATGGGAAVPVDVPDDVPDTAAESPPPPTSPSSTDTADDLFAFRGPADAQPAVDLEETASIRGNALPDLSDTMMGTKEAQPAEEGDLTGSYDDWEDWAPHPKSSGGRAKVLIALALLLALAAGAVYVYRDTLMPLVGLGEGSGTEVAQDSSAPADTSSPAGPESSGEPESADAEDPLTEPVEGLDLDDFLNEGEADDTPPGGDEESASSRPTTQADADSLRPPPTRRDSPPPPTTTQPPPPTATASANAGANAGATTPSDTTGRPARRVQSIQVRSRGGGTEVVVQLDGDLANSRYFHDQLSWAPDKEMVTLRGIGNFEQTEVRGNTSELLRVRIGYHPGDELRLVFDKTSSEVAIRGIEARGNQLVVRLSP